MGIEHTRPAYDRHLKTITDLITNDLVPALENTESIPGLKITSVEQQIHPDRFNRIEFTVDDEKFAISLFRPGPCDMTDEALRGSIAIDLPLDKPEIGEEAIKAVGSQFNSDFRVSNPKLHELYVGWARQTIQITQRMCRELWDQSRWPASNIASEAWAALVEHIKTDAAWFEAAALEFMNPEGDFVQGPTILAGESLRGIPPGEFEGVIVEREGKLYFELSDNPVKAG